MEHCLRPALRSQFPSRGLVNFKNLVVRPSALSGDAALVGAADTGVQPIILERRSALGNEAAA